MEVLNGVFLFCLFMVIYPYFLFPLLLVVWSRLGGRKWRKGESYPSISLIISVYNEEAVIREKIHNSLALDYPKERLEIVVVSDGSTDGTNQIVSSFTNGNVVLKAYERAGKTECLNRVVAELDGEILVFTDANSMFPQQALREIASNFNDDEIGLVTGWTKYRRQGATEEEAPGFYSRLERITKSAESQISSCVGADGAVFAIRRHLYRPLEDYDINDFVIPLHILEQGKRVILDPEVYCLEESSVSAKKEFRRQARITNRTLGAIQRNVHFLNPKRFGSFAFFLFSHKILRFMVPFASCGLIVSCLALMQSSKVFVILFALMSVLLLGTIGHLMGFVQSRVTNICAVFLLTNLAQMVGWFRFVTGRTDTLWTPQR